MTTFLKKYEKVMKEYRNSGIDINPVFYDSPEQNYRMRVEYNLIKKNGNLEFSEFSKETLNRASKSIYLIAELLLEYINSIEVLKNKLFRLDFISNQKGDIVMTMIYHKEINDEWEKQANSLKEKFKINIIGQSKKKKIVLGNEYVIEDIHLLKKTLKYKYSYGIFTQPNSIINQKMLNWVIESTKNIDGDLLELYCGCGNFTIALSENFDKILGSEIVKKSIVDAKYNIELNDINNIEFVRMSSQEIELAFNNSREFNRLPSKQIKKYNFNTVLVDPPRSGLTDDVIKFIKNFKTIIYISCNPATCLRDIIKLNNHKIINSAFFDQFPGTEHIESGFILNKI